MVQIALYIAILSPLVWYVGQACYKNGQVFIMHLSKNDIEITKRINYLLLVGYYLLVFGLVSASIVTLTPGSNHAILIKNLCLSIGKMILVIAIMHYINILSIHLYFKQLKK